MNGHRDWNAWNTSLWLNNDEGLYGLMLVAVTKSPFVQTCAAWLLESIGETHTPDGAEWNVDDLIEAIEEEHEEYWADA